MEIKEKDFIEIEFIAKVSETGEVFDTNIKEESIKANLNIKETKPLILSVGEGMAIKGLDESLKGKKIGEKYSTILSPENAFGKRDSNLVKMIPLKLFLQQKIMPEKGMQLSLDGMIVKILSNSGGRVLVDFNNPLAGKEILYEVNILRKIDKIEEKVDSLQDFFFRKKFPVSIDEKQNKLKINISKEFTQVSSFLVKKFEDILGITVEISPQEKEENKIK